MLWAFMLAPSRKPTFIVSKLPNIRGVFMFRLVYREASQISLQLCLETYKLHLNHGNYIGRLRVNINLLCSKHHLLIRIFVGCRYKKAR